MTEPDAHRGSVAAFDERRGVGEVVDEQGARFAFHSTQISDGTRRIAVGATVTFVVRAGLGGRWEASRIETER